MSWLALAYYKNKVDTIGGEDTDHDEELHYKVKHYVKKGCQRIEVFKNIGTIFPAGIENIKTRKEVIRDEQSRIK